MDFYSSIKSVKSLVSINWYDDPLLQMSAGVHSTFDWPWVWFDLGSAASHIEKLSQLKWWDWNGFLEHNPEDIFSTVPSGASGERAGVVVVRTVRWLLWTSREENDHCMFGYWTMWASTHRNDHWSRVHSLLRQDPSGNASAVSAQKNTSFSEDLRWFWDEVPSLLFQHHRMFQHPTNSSCGYENYTVSDVLMFVDLILR